MQSKKKDQDNSNIWLGIAGIAIGAVGALVGYGISELTKDDEKEKEKEKLRQQQIIQQQQAQQEQYYRQQQQQQNKKPQQPQFTSQTNQMDNDNIMCPISQDVMTDPYIIKTCGHSFQKESITQWLQKQQSCPICKQKATPQDLIPNYTLKNTIQDLIKK